MGHMHPLGAMAVTLPNKLVEVGFLHYEVHDVEKLLAIGYPDVSSFATQVLTGWCSANGVVEPNGAIAGVDDHRPAKVAAKWLEHVLAQVFQVFHLFP